MILKEFIKKLEKIAKEQGTGAEVIMADNILVSEPIYTRNYFQRKRAVIITDQ